MSEAAKEVRRERPVRGPRIPPGLGRFQDLARAIGGWAFRWHAGLRVFGREHVPRSGPLILAANHRSMLDIPLLVLASPRRVHFMAKSVIFRGPISTRFFQGLGGFRVRREIVDVRAMDVALAILERGDVLGIYPEGTRSRTGEMKEFLGGTAWLALKTGAPIVPCGIVGTEMGTRAKGFLGRLGLPPLRRRVRITFGPPILVERDLSPGARKEKAPAITGRLLGEIVRLAS